jgi:medium-chain acyl-[acyl-carrier-protein] hydrolase
LNLNVETAFKIIRMMSKSAIEHSWLALPKPYPNADLRLFCFPYAGGSALIYRDWWKGLTSHIEVCAVQLPGRGMRLGEPPFTRVEPLVDALMPVIMAHADKPFAFFGHSMGALISFELARALRREHGVEPFHLFISGRQAPSVTDNEKTYDLPEQEFIEEVRRLNGTPKEILENAELMHLMLPLLRADFQLCETYTHAPGPPLDCPLTVFGGMQDCVTPEELDQWRAYTNGPFALRRLPGDHFFLHTSQPLMLKVLAQKLLQQLHATARK